MADIRELLNEEIENQIQNLNDLSTGSEEKSKAVDDLATLYRLRIEETKAETEREEKRVATTEMAKDRNFKLIAEAGIATMTMAFYAYWMRKGFKFEETGTFTSTTFRGLFNKFKPTKK